MRLIKAMLMAAVLQLMHPGAAFADKPAGSPRVEVDQKIGKFIALWNSHDADGIGALFAKEGDFVGISGALWPDPAEIVRVHRQLFQGRYDRSVYAEEGTPSISEIRPGVVVAHWKWTISRVRDEQGRELAPYSGLFTWVMVRTDHDWVIQSAQNMTVAAAPATGPATADGVVSDLPQSMVDRQAYASRALLPDFTAPACDSNPRSLDQVKGNLYRHTTGAGLAVHSGLVLITKAGALVVDPAMTCTASWLRDEIHRRFGVGVKYVVYTHAHADHISGGQIFKADGAVILANRRALEPIVGEKIPTALPDQVFDTDMTVTLGGETVLLHRVAPSHSDSMTMVLFPGYRALQCTDVCESGTMPYNDFLDFYYDGWIDTLDWVAGQEADIIDVGHYTPATKADEAALRDYLVDLHQQVLDLARAGQSWDELYRHVRFSEQTRSWIGFDAMHTLNILGMYRWVESHRRGEW